MEKRQKLYIRELQILAQEKDLISVLLKLLSWLFKHIECGQTIQNQMHPEKVFQIQLISTHSVLIRLNYCLLYSFALIITR